MNDENQTRGFRETARNDSRDIMNIIDDLINATAFEER